MSKREIKEVRENRKREREWKRGRGELWSKAQSSGVTLIVCCVKPTSTTTLFA